MIMWILATYCCTTSFNKTRIQVLRRFKSCKRRVRDLRWWGSLVVVPAGNKAKRLSSVDHTTKAIQFNSHTIWYLPAQSYKRWRWGGVCGVLCVCSEYPIVTSLMLFLCHYCWLWAYFASSFFDPVVDFG